MKNMIGKIIILWSFASASWPWSIQVSTTPIIFGRYSSFDSSDLIGSGEIEILCLPDDANAKEQVMCIGWVNIGLSAGKSGNVFKRKMFSNNGSNFLEYNLFSDPNIRTIWGDSKDQNKGIKYRLRLNASEAYTVFGAIKAKQYTPSGIYQDSLIVSIEF